MPRERPISQAARRSSRPFVELEHVQPNVGQPFRPGPLLGRLQQHLPDSYASPARFDEQVVNTAPGTIDVARIVRATNQPLDESDDLAVVVRDRYEAILAGKQLLKLTATVTRHRRYPQQPRFASGMEPVELDKEIANRFEVDGLGRADD